MIVVSKSVLFIALGFFSYAAFGMGGVACAAFLAALYEFSRR